jgi:hypothetical protein
MNDELQMANDELKSPKRAGMPLVICNSSFGIRHTFVICHWSFVISPFYARSCW